MKLNKKKVIALALAVCLIAILSMSSLAWFTDSDSVTNDFLIAGSDDSNPDDVFSVDVWEDADPEDEEGEEKIQDGITYPDILPGDDLYKEVNVENTGAYPQYIRVTVTISDASIWQDIYGELVVPLTEIVNVDTDALYNDTIISYYDPASDSLVYVLYYENILGVDEVYTVFTNVHIPEEMDRYQAAAMTKDGFQINVVADAVQTENVGDNVIEAFTTVGLYDVIPVAPDSLADALTSGADRVVLDPTADWSNTVLVDYDVANVTIDANGTNATFKFTGLADNVTIVNLHDTDDTDAASVDVTGAVAGSSVTITDSYLVDRSSRPFGAVVVGPNADITIDNCELVGIEKSYGVYGTSSGKVTITNSTFRNFGSWAIQVNGVANGDMLIDNCVFETPDGVLKVLSGVNGNFTFTNNTLIGCKGHDGAGLNALIVSTSAKYNPLTATGIITYANNTYIAADGKEPTEVVSDPIVGDSEGEAYEGDLFEPGSYDFLVVQNQVLIGNANISVERTYRTVVLENVTAATEGNLITAKTDNTIILHNCDITLEKGAKLIVGDGATVGQVMMHNVTVNGELLTQETAAQYLEGVNWYEVW